MGSVAGLTDGQLLDRFTTRGGEAAEPAFAALVERHGPMVLRVCRATLRDPHDAEDAFQATFLVLARRARAIRDRNSVGPWLYGVALRVSACTRATAARRRTRERIAAEMARPFAGDEAGDDLPSVLHEEIGRLPERYRMAVVLCDLEGLTHAEAARKLGWPMGTVKSRQARGRERLRDRLTRRGLNPAVGLPLAPTPIPEALANRTIRAASCIAGHGSAIASAANTLAQGIARDLMMAGLIRAFLALVAASLLATGLAAWAQHPARPTPPPGDGPPEPGHRPDEPNKLAAGKDGGLLKVLYLQGPRFSWEPRFLSRALDPSLDIELDMMLTRRPGELNDALLAPGRYDLYILGDLPADLLTRPQHRLLATAVERGAGLIMLGGHKSFGAGGWAGTELADILPVRIGPDDGWFEPEGGVRIIPEAGIAPAPFLQFGSTAAETARSFAQLPPLTGVNRVGPPKPAALIVARTEENLPLLIVQDVGKGRVMAITGETWPWARDTEEGRRIYRQFWRQALRWAAHR